MVEVYDRLAALVAARCPDTPVLLLRPGLLERTAAAVRAAFPGEVWYAVKCNPLPQVLEALRRGGVDCFDVASIGEVRSLRALLGREVRLAFMHPVKPEEAIIEAYRDWGVRRFALDSAEEFEKIRRVTAGARDVELVVRLKVDDRKARLPFSGKFGADPSEAAALLRRVRREYGFCGLTFHVGSQCLDPGAFVRALRCARWVVEAAGGVDLLDVGGGFPVSYVGSEPPFAAFVEAICETLAGWPDRPALACEPGRLLVAEALSLLVRVELRRGSKLYLNDGVFGHLSELRSLGPGFPMRVVLPRRRAPLEGFTLYGPTCDGEDVMPGPHLLPGDVRTGDWIEIGMMGAYSVSLRTGFNGMPEGELWVLEEDVGIGGRTGSRLVRAA